MKRSIFNILAFIICFQPSSAMGEEDSTYFYYLFPEAEENDKLNIFKNPLPHWGRELQKITKPAAEAAEDAAEHYAEQAREIGREFDEKVTQKVGSAAQSELENLGEYLGDRAKVLEGAVVSELENFADTDVEGIVKDPGQYFAERLAGLDEARLNETANFIEYTASNYDKLVNSLKAELEALIEYVKDQIFTIYFMNPSVTKNGKYMFPMAICHSDTDCQKFTSPDTIPTDLDVDPVYFVNGVMNSYHDALDSAAKLSISLDGRPVRLVYNMSTVEPTNSKLSSDIKHLPDTLKLESSNDFEEFLKDRLWPVLSLKKSHFPPKNLYNFWRTFHMAK
ncbi:MAG: hypothetical protein HRU19_31595, partial [Pseudobacteriovorax sp.]|nr:hypothetical protein [Pseudobacteriovorax sp.]